MKDNKKAISMRLSNADIKNLSVLQSVFSINRTEIVRSLIQQFIDKHMDWIEEKSGTKYNKTDNIFVDNQINDNDPKL